jgi:hypothetical protein
MDRPPALSPARHREAPPIFQPLPRSPADYDSLLRIATSAGGPPPSPYGLPAGSSTYYPSHHRHTPRSPSRSPPSRSSQRPRGRADSPPSRGRHADRKRRCRSPAAPPRDADRRSSPSPLRSSSGSGSRRRLDTSRPNIAGLPARRGDDHPRRLWSPPSGSRTSTTRDSSPPRAPKPASPPGPPPPPSAPDGVPSATPAAPAHLPASSPPVAAQSIEAAQLADPPAYPGPPLSSVGGGTLTPRMSPASNLHRPTVSTPVRASSTQLLLGLDPCDSDLSDGEPPGAVPAAPPPCHPAAANGPGEHTPSSPTSVGTVILSRSPSPGLHPPARPPPTWTPSPPPGAAAPRPDPAPPPHPAARRALSWRPRPS